MNTRDTIKKLAIRYLLIPFAIATALIAMAIVTSSCQDDDRVSKIGVLTATPWKITRFELGDDDLTDDREACEVDNFMIFERNGTLINDVGHVRCDDDDYNGYGTWNFKADERIIRLHSAGEPALDWKIVTLTDQTFKITRYFEASHAEAVITMIPQ